MGHVTEQDMRVAARAIAFQRMMQEYRETYPSEWYEPHHTCFRGPFKGRPSGQLQFHQSTHPARVMAPGNGWGGTTAMGIELDAWMRHTNRWQKTPERPISAWWFCPKYAQFEEVRKHLEEFCIGTVPTLKTSTWGGPQYVWPDGGTLTIGSYDSSWKGVQGIELDLVIFDEQPPMQLWREMGQRRRGRRKTRFICKATQTQGWSWMGEDLYKPWRARHIEMGITDEEQMLIEQRDDYLWVWSRGGIHDNPAMDEQDIAEYEARPWSGPKERKVRVYGGFESFAGDPVFDQYALEWYEKMQQTWEEAFGPVESGSLVAQLAKAGEEFAGWEA